MILNQHKDAGNYHTNNCHYNQKPLQVFTEQSWPLDAFCAAVQIMDKFLDICCHILRSQLQVRTQYGLCGTVQLQVRPSIRHFTASKTAAPFPRPNALLKFAKKLANRKEGKNLTEGHT